MRGTDDDGADDGGEEAGLSEAELLALFDPDPVVAMQHLAELRRQLFRFLRPQCRESEDAVQEVLLRGVRRLRRSRVSLDEHGPRAYFFGIARNVIREEWKPKRRREQQAEPGHLESRPSTGREAMRAEAAIEVDQVLSQLSEEESDFLLRYIAEGPEGLALELGTTVQNVRVKAFRIRERLRASRAD